MKFHTSKSNELQRCNGFSSQNCFHLSSACISHHQGQKQVMVQKRMRANYQRKKREEISLSLIINNNNNLRVSPYLPGQLSLWQRSVYSHNYETAHQILQLMQ